MATCSDDFKVKIWNPNTNWTLTRTYTNHTNMVYGIEWINADTIASCSEEIQIWSISTGVTKKTIKNGKLNYALQLLSDGNLAVGIRNAINIYDISTGSLIKGLSVGETAFSNDLALLSSTLLASSFDDNTIRIWDLTTNTQKLQIKETTISYGLKLIASNILASGNYDGTISLWNKETGALIRNLKSSKSIGEIYYAVDSFANNQGLVSCNYGTLNKKLVGNKDGFINFWDWTTGQLLYTVNASENIYSLATIQSINVLSKS